MGADAFIAFVGIKRVIDLGADSELIELQERTHPLIRAARKNGLQFYDGRLTDGEDIFLFIGRTILRDGQTTLDAAPKSPIFQQFRPR
ncbi:MAG: hypothetical protein JNJ70_14000 [Verrucomicrobiales bacterium]|nr:hypothetical protein [Verrucomicrobiales bacterium]